MIKITIDSRARSLFKLQEGEKKPEPLLQPGMNATYTVEGSTRNGIVEGVYLRSRSYKHPARYEYHVSGSESLLHDSSIVSSRWPDNIQNPDFEKGQEYSIDVLFREHPIKAIVQVQTSLSKGADVILYSPDENEFYAVRKTTLEKMLGKKKSQKQGTSIPMPIPDLHKIAV